MTTRELFLWVDVIRLQIALGSLTLFLPLHETSELLRAYTGEAGRLRRNCCASVGGLSRAGGDGGCVAGLSVVGALVLAVDAAPYFRWGDAGQHVEIWSRFRSLYPQGKKPTHR